MQTTHPKNSVKRRRGAPAHPRRGNVRDPRITTTEFAIYSGRDRLGSFRRRGAVFEAFDRRRRFLGSFPSQGQACEVVEREAAAS